MKVQSARHRRVPLLLRRGLGAALLVAAIAAVIPSAASASGFISMQEARYGINHLVRHKNSTGYEPGSMLLYCSRRAANYVSCDLMFRDDYGDSWCGHASARLRGGTVSSKMNVYDSGCEDF